MIERRLPIFARKAGKRGRYYIRDNFLRSWLGCLANAVSALDFRPEDLLIQQADERLADAEGFGLERLVGQLYQERSRRGLGDFPLTHRIEGYWDRNDTEIDLVGLNEDEQVIRFGSCKRSAQRLLADLDNFSGHVERFLEALPRFRSWRIEKVAVAPFITNDMRAAIIGQGFLSQDLSDLVRGL
jgi:AAA+ ATPase superfamily predicted ATPase